MNMKMDTIKTTIMPFSAPSVFIVTSSAYTLPENSLEKPTSIKTRFTTPEINEKF
jgi:hypothetical protein